jgi:hypothetical protein
LTRLDNILSRLRGAVKINDIDLKDDKEKPVSQEVKNLQTNLSNQQNKEKERKQMRKQLEDEKDLEKVMKPDANVENVPQELAQAPVQVEKPKAPAKIPAAPAVG